MSAKMDSTWNVCRVHMSSVHVMYIQRWLQSCKNEGLNVRDHEMNVCFHSLATMLENKYCERKEDLIKITINNNNNIRNNKELIELLNEYFFRTQSNSWYQNKHELFHLTTATLILYFSQSTRCANVTHNVSSITHMALYSWRYSIPQM